MTLFEKEAKISAELEEEISNQALHVEGEIPGWLSGTLVRNGPVKVTVNGQSNAHWFDGLAMLHAFSFHEGKVSYSNKFLRSDAYQAVFKNGSLNYLGFAVDPCRSIFKKFLTFFIADSVPPIQNANVNVAKIADQYVALTEVPLPVKFDLKTLETLGVLNYEDSLPREKCWESAHPHYDKARREIINYLVQFGKRSYYNIYKIKDGMNERDVIAKIPVDKPAYMHSFAQTERFIILTEFPFVVKPLELILKNQAFIKNYHWEPARGTKFKVIDKENGKLVGEYLTKPFFAFHHANAFEEEGKIYLDIVTYPDASIITSQTLYVNTERINSRVSKLERFTLNLATGKIDSEVIFSKFCEFPRINSRLDGLPYQYLYLVHFDQSAKTKKAYLNGVGLYKVNNQSLDFVEWSEEGCSGGEPVFVEAPNAEGEDDGVVLAVILDKIKNNSFLLILDGKSFKEIGRVVAPHAIPEGLHGQFFK